MASLRNDPKFICILDYLKAEVLASDDKMRHLESLPQVYRQQGCGQSLLSLIEKAQSAHTYLNSKE